MTDPFILAQRTDGVATITINRPDRRNALNRDAKEQLREALECVGRDAAVRAVVLTGAGNSFNVGQDLAEHADALRADPGTAFETVEAHYLPIVASIASMPKPVIAAINGTCGTCRAKVTAGEVDLRRNYALEPAELDAGFVLTCQSYPLGDKAPVDFDA